MHQSSYPPLQECGRQSSAGSIEIRLKDLAATRVLYGYRRLHILLRRTVNVKRVYRLDKQVLDKQVLDKQVLDKQVLERYRVEYNKERPHSSLRDRTPAEYLVEWALRQEKRKRKIADPLASQGIWMEAAG